MSEKKNQQNLKITFIGLISGISSFVMFKIIYLPFEFFNLLLRILISSLISLVIFDSLSIILKIEGIEDFNKFLKEKFIHP